MRIFKETLFKIGDRVYFGDYTPTEVIKCPTCGCQTLDKKGEFFINSGVITDFKYEVKRDILYAELDITSIGYDVDLLYLREMDVPKDK